MKRLLAGVVLGSVLALVVMSAVAAEIQYNVVVNGKPLVADVPPMNVQGRLLLPLRAVAEALGADVDYDPATFTAIITTNSSGGTLSATQQKELLDINELRARVNQNAHFSLTLISDVARVLESVEASMSPSEFEEYWSDVEGWVLFSNERLTEVKHALAFSPEASRMIEDQAAGAETPEKLQQRLDQLWGTVVKAKALLAEGRISDMKATLSIIRKEIAELTWAIAAYDAAIMSRTADLIEALNP